MNIIFWAETISENWPRINEVEYYINSSLLSVREYSITLVSWIKSPIGCFFSQWLSKAVHLCQKRKKKKEKRKKKKEKIELNPP
jgi:hypothetical protein